MNTKSNLLIDENLRMLGKMLYNTIRSAEGDELLDIIEQIRDEAQRKKAHKDSIASKKLINLIGTLSNEQLHVVAQAFNQFLNLINTTEQFNSISESESKGAHNPISFTRIYRTLKDKGVEDSDIKQSVESLSMDLVLTAHPTETNRRSLINNLNETTYCLEALSNSNLADYKKNEVIRRLSQLIEQYWFTDEIRKKKPTPVEEAKWGNDVIETSLWYAIPQFIRGLNLQLAEELDGYKLPIEACPIRFSAWMGGDRDGNPNVTAEVTKQVLLANRRRAAKLFLADIEILVKELSQSRATPEFLAYLGDPQASEPYRDLMKSLRGKLKLTLEYFDDLLEGRVPQTSSSEVILNNEELWTPLKQCYDSLIACNMTAIAEANLADTLRRVQAFGVSLVKTDVRQESTVHTETISEITRFLGLGDYAEWSESEKQAFLIRELSSRRPLLPNSWTPSAQTQEVLDTFRVIAKVPEGIIPVYLISMAQKPSDVLAVHLLLKETNCPYYLPVAPLFETLNDLEEAASVMEQLYKIDWYRGIIRNRQMVMIGYSDSAKDAGALAAGWAQYEAQERLLKVAEEHNILLTLFHGRGGTIGRGGGPAKIALFSQPPGSLKGGLRVTEQGEMIRFKYGLPALAIQTFDLYLEAILEANLLTLPTPKPEWRDVMNRMRDSSCKIYQDLVRRNPDFIQYFYEATPEAELAKLPIGSRPAKRRSTPSLEGLRAIPWIFGWSQNRLMLPAWLGAGEAMQEVIDQGERALLEEMYREWPFFNTRVSMLEMVFAKADLSVAEYYDAQLVRKEYRYIGEALRKQMLQDVATVLSISHDKDLMDDVYTHKGKNKVTIRNGFTLPLNLLQVELLKRYRATEEPSTTLEEALMITISGIAAGMRNSG